MIECCPYCGSRSLSVLRLDPPYPGDGAYKCKDCGARWTLSDADTEKLGGLDRNKYKVYRPNSSDPIGKPYFVLLYETDPAARVALRAYSMATNNGVLAQDLDTILNRMDRKPQDFPPKGSEGQLNSDVCYRHFDSEDMGVLIIQKDIDDEDDNE